MLRVILGIIAGFFVMSVVRLLLGSRSRGEKKVATGAGSSRFGSADGTKAVPKLIRCDACGVAVPATRALPLPSGRGFACSDTCRGRVAASA